jgi:sugar O-acyltransferase (sialic acid O-acetyltransferase NeuD family)
MKLLIVAASGLAREVLAVERRLGRTTRLRILDDDPSRWETIMDGVPVVGGLSCVTSYADHQLLICAGRGTARRDIVRRLAALGVTRERYATLVHPRVEVPPGCTIGVGSILLEGVVLTARVHIGDHAVVMPHTTLTHDVALGDYTTVCAGATLGGAVRVGSGAYIGMNACVRETLTVGCDAVLGMGAALVDHQPDGETWVGTPARPLVRAPAIVRQRAVAGG